MQKFIVSSLVACTAALSHDGVNDVQVPIIAESCPLASLLNGECQPASNIDRISEQANHSKTLQQSYESARSTPDFPWTFWPECYSNENTTESICAFSSQEFASGRGIYIVTTTSRAYSILSKPAFSKPKSLSRVNKHSNPPFEHRDFPGKGRGLIANKTLHRGDQIFASTPLVLTDQDSYFLSEKERHSLIHLGVETLPTDSQPLFWSLLDHFKGDPVDDRINTNAFDISIDNKPFLAVMPEIAMLNHDCRPNAAYFWDEETLTHYVHATQTIYPGEEITITYINNERKRHDRVSKLKSNWGFECSCSACAAHPYFVKESDERMEAITEITDELADWTGESIATVGMAEELISLYEQERLFANLGTPYKIAAETYASFGDADRASKYARLAVEYTVLDKGWDDSDVRDLKKMVKEPEMTWSWKKRVQAKGCGCGGRH